LPFSFFLFLKKVLIFISHLMREVVRQFCRIKAAQTQTEGVAYYLLLSVL